MSSSQTPSNSQPSSHSYFTLPVKAAVRSAFRSLSSDPLKTKSSSNSREPSRNRNPKPRRADSYEDDFQDFQQGDLIDFDDSGETFANQGSSKTEDHWFQTSGNLGASGHASFEPPTRATPPPFQPPPLTPLTLRGTSDNSQILSNLLAEEIRLLLPPRLQLVDLWKLTFSLERDGASLATLYDKCENFSGKRGGFVVAVKDASGNMFGAYLSDPPHPSKGHYYGNGECFLWRSTLLSSSFIPSLASLPPPPSADTTNATRMTSLGSPTSGSALENGINEVAAHGRQMEGSNAGDSQEMIRFKAFPYSGINDYMIFCEHGFLSVGGGDGHYGLWLDGSLESGISSSCPTFGNEPLSDDGTKFEVLDVEIWYLGV